MEDLILMEASGGLMGVVTGVSWSTVLNQLRIASLNPSAPSTYDLPLAVADASRSKRQKTQAAALRLLQRTQHSF